MNDLTPLQQSLWAVFKDKPDIDVAIVDMYIAAYVSDSMADFYRFGKLCDVRHMQQKLSPLLQRLNAKLPEGQRIEPGQLKRTYRLNTKASV